MPPRKLSRHTFTLGFKDALAGEDSEAVQLTDRVPFTYRELPDNRQHVVNQGDSLWTLAGRYFAPTERASGLWWVIADFQPDPIHDPTITLTPGTTLVIPSLRTVHELIFSENRRNEAVEQ